MADWPTTLEEARALDAADPLSAFRERFVVVDPELIYLDGNSLGRLPRATGERLATVAGHEWGERLVRGEPTEVREVRALMQANVQVLELVVADVIKALIDGGRMDKRMAKQFADEFAQRVNQAPFQYAVGAGS